MKYKSNKQEKGSTFLEQFICIAFLFFLCGLLIAGLSLLRKASFDEHQNQIDQLNLAIDKWEEQRGYFEDLQIYVQIGDSDMHQLQASDEKDWHLPTQELLDYKHLKYNTTEQLFNENLQGLSLQIDELDKQCFNLTGNMFIQITDKQGHQFHDIIPDITLFEQKQNLYNMKCNFHSACQIHQFSLWDYTTHRCYSHYKLLDLCIVIDQYTFKPIGQRGCFNHDQEVFQPFPFPSLYKPTELNFETSIQVRSNLDPMIYAHQNNIIHLSPTSLEIQISAWIFICVAILFGIIPGFFLCTRTKR